MKSLHYLQAKLLEALRDVPQGGYSLEELRRMIGAAHKSQVVHHMHQLEAKGLLKSDPDNPDGYILFNEETAEEPFVFMPLLALASCGKGIDNAQHVIERLPVRPRMIPGRVSESFLVKTEGDSMEPRIHHGDVLLVEKFKEGSREPLGQIVICEENHEVKVKQFTKSGTSIVLVSLNREYDPHVVTNPDRFRIHGIVRSVLFSKI